MSDDMSTVIAPKSDQQNADDFLSGPRTVTITGVKVNKGQEQPVWISFVGDDGRPWKPNKGTSRLLVYAWGTDAKQYVGRSVTLYRDPKVRWAGKEEGGIRISHMSNIDREIIFQDTVSKGKRNPRIVKPLENITDHARERADAWADTFIASLADCEDVPALLLKEEKTINRLRSGYPDIAKRIDDVVNVETEE